jgi:hypothetical protein
MGLHEISGIGAKRTTFDPWCGNPILHHHQAAFEAAAGRGLPYDRRALEPSGPRLPGRLDGFRMVRAARFFGQVVSGQRVGA